MYLLFIPCVGFVIFGVIWLCGEVIYDKIQVDVDDMSRLGAGVCIVILAIFSMIAIINNGQSIKNAKTYFDREEKLNQSVMDGTYQVSEIKLWNYEITNNRKHHDNLWYGIIFFPMDYYQFDLIEIPELEQEIN